MTSVSLVSQMLSKATLCLCCVTAMTSATRSFVMASCRNEDSLSGIYGISCLGFFFFFWLSLIWNRAQVNISKSHFVLGSFSCEWRLWAMYSMRFLADSGQEEALAGQRLHILASPPIRALPTLLVKHLIFTQNYLNCHKASSSLVWSLDLAIGCALYQPSWAATTKYKKLGTPNPNFLNRVPWSSTKYHNSI